MPLDPRTIDLEPLAKPLRGKLARRVAGQPERIGDRRPEKRIAERAEDQRERALGDVMLLVADAELGHEAADGNRGSG